jgi:hypothetical protein
MIKRLAAEKANLEQLIEHLETCVSQDALIVDLMVNAGRMESAKELALQTIDTEKEIKKFKEQIKDLDGRILEIELEIAFG